MEVLIGINAAVMMAFMWLGYRKWLKIQDALSRLAVHSTETANNVVALASDTSIKMKGLREISQKALDQVKSLINLDVGLHHDCGWLVLITKVAGQDRVMLQELKPGMNIHEYDDLVMRLRHDCAAHLAFIDAPMGYGEAFLQRHRVRTSRR